MSKSNLEGVWNVYGRCLECVWKVFKRCLEGSGTPKINLEPNNLSSFWIQFFLTQHFAPQIFLHPKYFATKIFQHKKSGQVMSGEFKSGQVKSGRVQSTLDELSLDWPSPVKTGQVYLEHVPFFFQCPWSLYCIWKFIRHQRVPKGLNGQGVFQGCFQGGLRQFQKSSRLSNLAANTPIINF